MGKSKIIYEIWYEWNKYAEDGPTVVLFVGNDSSLVKYFFKIKDFKIFYLIFWLYNTYSMLYYWRAVWNVLSIGNRYINIYI